MLSNWLVWEEITWIFHCQAVNIEQIRRSLYVQESVGGGRGGEVKGLRVYVPEHHGCR